MFTLPPASAERVAQYIRRAQSKRSDEYKGTITRLTIRCSVSLWRHANIMSATNKRVLTSAPDFPAFASIAYGILPRHSRFTRRERAFVLQAAQEAQANGLWFCEHAPQTLIFRLDHFCVAAEYSEQLLDFILSKLEE